MSLRRASCVVWLVLAACGSNSSSTDAGAMAAPDGGAAKPPAPASLRQFESGAEAMSDAPRGILPAHVPNWTMAEAAHQTNAKLWPEVKTAVLAVGASATTISTIEAALGAYAKDVAEKRQRDAESDANLITVAVPDLFDLFTYSAPTDSLRLDGTFRQLQIEAEYQDWTKAAKALDDTKVVWQRMKPLVQGQAPSRPDLMGSVTVVVDTDAAIDRAQALIAKADHTAEDAASLSNEAQKGLDLVDVCEQIFK